MVEEEEAVGGIRASETGDYPISTIVKHSSCLNFLLGIKDAHNACSNEATWIYTV